MFDVASVLSQFAVERLTPFLRQNGGWVRKNSISLVTFNQNLVIFQSTICEAFPLDSDYEGKIWQSLMITGLGLTAVATFLALQH